MLDLINRRCWKPLALLAIALLSAPSANAAGGCDTACLRGHMDRYLAALIRQDPSSLAVTTDLRFTENGKTGRLGDGLWRGASSVGSFRHVLADSSTQQSLFIGTINEGSVPALAALRLAVHDGKLVEVEHVVARQGSHPLFAPQAAVAHPTLTSVIPTGERRSREQLVAIADSYFEGIERHSSRDVLASDSCQRIENGVQTTGQPGRASRNCAASADLLTYIKAVADRRFPIVDVEHGIVVATVLFDIPGERAATTAPDGDPQVAARLREPRTLLLTEWFRIDAGKIQHIEAIMHNLPHGSRSGWEQ